MPIVISSMSVLISVGQVVSRNALHEEPPCYAYPILLQILGLLIKYILNRDILTHGLVTLTYLIMMETMSGYPDVALHIQSTSITFLIVFIYKHIMETGIVTGIVPTVILLLLILLVVVSIPCLLYTSDAADE